MIAAILVVMMAGGVVAAAPTAARTYTNPVIAHDFPDPAVVRLPDGTLWVHLRLAHL